MSLERLKFYIKHSINDLKVNKQRSLFGLFCIAAGVAAIVGLLILGVMVENTLTGSLQETNRGDIRYRAFGGSDFNEDGETAAEDDTFTTNFYISKAGLERLIQAYAEHFNVSAAENCTDNSPFCITPRQAITGDSGVFIMSTDDSGDLLSSLTDAFIVDVSRYPLYGEVKTDNGDSLAELIDPASYTDSTSVTGDIVISQNLADTLNVKVGDKVSLNGASKDFTVRGIVPTRTEGGFENIAGSILGYYYLDVNARGLFTDMQESYSNIYVKLKNSTNLNELAETLEKQTDYINYVTTNDVKDENEDISLVVTQFVSMMGLISMLIGGIGIVNTMLVIVRRRTNEVAVLKTLGLQPTEISLLFLVEAVIMGIVGSLMGIVFGIGLVFIVKGAAEAFISQSLAVTITPTPLIMGLVVGTLITATFGFLPIISASQVRPATVLRPQENIAPSTGIIRSIGALIIVVLALSIISQGMLNDMLSGDDVKTMKLISSIVTAVMALLLGASMLFSKTYLSWTSDNLVLRIIRWGLFLIVLPAIGYLLGGAIPALLVMMVVFILVGYLYVLLWVLIWAAGGGTFSDLWPGILMLLFPLFWPLIPILIVVVIPVWILGRLIQRFSFVDFKIAMRSMLASKGRGASTLVALVVGIFTLALITMMVGTIRKAFETQIIEQAGGNLIAFAGNNQSSLDGLQQTLNSDLDGVNSFAILSQYRVEFVSFRDTSAGETYNSQQLQAHIPDNNDYLNLVDQLEGGIDARSVQSNLPNVKFHKGRQLEVSDMGQSVIVVPATDATLEAGFDVGDELTFRFISADGSGSIESEPVTFTIVGMTSEQGDFGSSFYVPIQFLPSGEAFSIAPQNINVLIDADEEKLSSISRELRKIEGVFVLETRVINDLINRLLDAFTQLPTIVAALSLFTGGIVIANSVALSMMERRREIAIMKAVGLKRRRVLNMLLLENGLMGLIGGFIGVGISSLLLYLALVGVFDSLLGKSIPYATAIILMLLCVGISLLAAILSVWSASSEKPLNVLRYE